MADRVVVGMDTGGTFTDGYFAYGDRVEKVKVDTTPHDLTVCFEKCIEEGAIKLGFTRIEDMLKLTDAIKFSSTVGSNALIQKTGPKLGLIVTKDHEKDLYGKSARKPAVVDSIILSNMIKGIKDEIDSNGKLIKPPEEKEVKKTLEYLLENGARTIVVSLKNAFYNPENEEKVKEIIREDMPIHYLGSVPVLLCTEISKRPDDYLATNTVLLNAYFHKDLALYLYKAEGNLQKKGYTKPLFIVLNNSGITRLAKTKAIDTYGSGPTSGVFAMNSISKAYNLKNVVGIDIGGTSTDISFIKDGQYRYHEESIIEGIQVDIPTVEVTSIGGGGGSIARVNSGTLTVGPDSAGAMPGPACYDLGGIEATITDANIILGFIDPDYFLGGRRKLNKESAADAIKLNIADPLGVNVNEAAYRIKCELDNTVSEGTEKLMKEASFEAKDFTIFSFGGAGGCHCCAAADVLNISKVYAFNFSSVFCAFGATNMDTLHIYEEFNPIRIFNGHGEYLNDFTEFNNTIDKMEKIALRDMRGEGFQPKDVKFKLDLETRIGSTLKHYIPSPILRIRKKEDIHTILREIPGYDKKPVWIELFSLKAISQMPRYKLPTYKKSKNAPRKAFKRTRDIWWKDGMEKTSIYEQKRLQYGNIIDGPAIIESEDTTHVIPERWKCTVDKYLNLQIRKRS